MTEPTGVVIGAGDRGANAYVPLLLAEPGLGRIVGVAEPDAVRRNGFGERFGIPDEHRFADHRDLLAGPAIADIALYPWLRGWKWSKVDITDRPNVVAWVDRMRARPGVARGLAYGVPKDEIDQWSDERKASYARGGASIASNDRLRSDS